MIGFEFRRGDEFKNIMISKLQQMPRHHIMTFQQSPEHPELFGIRFVPGGAGQHQNCAKVAQERHTSIHDRALKSVILEMILASRF